MSNSKKMVKYDCVMDSLQNILTKDILAILITTM
jgi:hypothetical protein